MNKMYILTQSDSEEGVLDVRVFVNYDDACKALRQDYEAVLKDDISAVEYSEIDDKGCRAMITFFHNYETMYFDIFEANLELNVKGA